MIPDDESVRRAMQSIEPAGADVPDLFDRVAAGARRRRRQRSIGAASAAAVVVAVVALVPALGRGTSSTKVQPIGSAASPTRVQMLGTGGPQVNPSTIASPLAMASSLPPVESPSPPLSSMPATSLSLPISTGTCAPGISAALQVGPARPVLVTPGVNTLHLSVGDLVTFTTDGPCASEYFYWPTGGTVFGALLPDGVVNPSSFGNAVTATATGTEELRLRRQACDDGGATCHSPTGPTLATIAVTVSPATVVYDTVANVAPSPLPTDASGCPTAPASELAGDVEGTASQEGLAVVAAIAAVPRLYGSTASHGFQVTSVYLASTQHGYGVAADGMCGKTLGDRSYVVELHFPNSDGSASIGNGQLFLAQFSTGWQVWYRYH
jgi:hypothetical protein